MREEKRGSGKRMWEEEVGRIKNKTGNEDGFQGLRDNYLWLGHRLRCKDLQISPDT